MGDRKKNENIVKKVFDREGPSKERLSALFTHFKMPGRVLTRGGPAADLRQDLFHGIEFGSCSIKWVQLIRSASGDLQLADLDEQSYEVLSGGNRFERERQALKKLMIRHPRSGRFVLSLSGRDAAYINLSFPRMEENELREAIVWKLKQIKPLNLEPERLSFNFVKWDAALDASGRETGHKVLVYCVPQQLVGEKLALLKECGIAPYGVDPAPLSLVNLKRRDPSSGSGRSEEVLVWLDLGEEESTMMVTKGGVPSYVRSIPLTGNQLTRQIAQYCQTDEARAEDLKRQYGMMFDEGLSVSIVPPEGSASDKKEATGAYKEMARKIRQGLTSVLENLVIDIEHSYKHFSYQISQSSLPAFSRVCLAGGAASLKGLDLYLSDRLGVPVDILSPFSGMKASDELVAAKAKQLQEPLKYAAACSLALDAMSSLVNPHNLMVRAARKTPSDLFQSAKKKPKMSVALALLVIALAIAPQIARVKMAERQATAASEKLQAAKKEAGKFQFDKLKAAEVEKELTDKKTALEARLNYLQGSMQHPKKLSEALNVLAAVLPSDIWIRTLAYKDRELSILGVAPRTDSIMKLIDELKKKPSHFSSPVFDYAQRDKEPEYDFQLKVSVV